MNSSNAAFPQTASDLLKCLRSQGDPERAAKSAKYMQATPGGYGEGDQFLGNSVPGIRLIAKDFAEMPLAELAEAFQSPWHECRLTSVFILVQRFEQSRKQVRRGTTDPTHLEELVDFYLEQLPFINNWDLVDSSSPKILGIWLLDDPSRRGILEQLAKTEGGLAKTKGRGFGTLEDMWKQRVAVLATMPLIKDQQFAEILELAERFLSHPHDLMHKAVGWMLREIGKRDINVLRSFLSAHVSDMPRTMLRYSIEKMDPQERSQWLAR